MDYQASTPVDPRVSSAMVPYLYEHPGNPHASDHSFGWEANAAVENAVGQIAVGIGADPDEVIFTSGATEANNLAILGAVARASSQRRRILVSSVEHKCVLAAAQVSSNRFGFAVEQLPVDVEGTVCLDQLRERLRDDVFLVSVMAVNNEIGTIQPIAEVSAMCHEVGALLHVDAVQALASGPLDVHQLEVELLSLSAHKIYGPKGIGALYIRRDAQRYIEPLIYGGGQQSGLRAGTLPVPLCVGFGEAVALMTDASATDEHLRIRDLRNRFLTGVRAIGKDIEVNGPTGLARHPGNANLRFPGVDAHGLLMALQPQLAAATGSACTSGVPEPSHVLRAIGLSIPQAMSSVRFGVGRFTTDGEIDQALAILRDMIPKAADSA
jgi:cysteine desulfurase